MAKKRNSNAGGKSVRQKASADIARRKAKHKRVSQLKRRALFATIAVAVAYSGFGVWWLVANDSITKAQNITNDTFWGMTARAGFSVKQVYLEGRAHLPQDTLKQALAIAPGDPILAISLEDMRARVMALPEVRDVQIRRTLPDALRITIEERKPVALWQRAGEYAVIDRDGVVLKRAVSDMPEGTLLVVGDDAPKHMKSLMAFLAEAPAIAPDVEAAVRVGERRWNIRLKQNVTVMLPESGAAEAWEKFAGLVEKERLLTKAIRSVDMRLEDRVFVTPVAQPQSPKILTSARGI